jgi:hypothetical protein
VQAREGIALAIYGTLALLFSVAAVLIHWAWIIAALLFAHVIEERSR